MFNGGNKTFGAAPTTGFGGFGSTTATVSPFGAPSAFGKPATPGFGQPSGFGQPAQSAFGAAQPTTSMFGAQANPTPAFGAPASTTPTGFGGFGQPQQTQPQTSLFGATAQPAANTSLFGQSSTSAFGAAKTPAFGGFGAQQPTSSLFSQSSTSTAPTSFGSFGAPAATGTTGMFGATATTASAFGQAGANGTAIARYQEMIGTDTLVKNGQTNNVSTKQHCITAMKEYEGKSLEELRMEDYLANRRGPQAGSTVAQPAAGGMFGATPATNTMFGSNTMGSTSIFGQTSQPSTNTLGGFGAATTTNTLGGFGQQQPQQPAVSTFGQPAQGSLFGTNNTSMFGNKTFGATTPATGGGLFGTAVSAAPTFGQTQPATTGFGTFGQTSAAQPPSLFGTGTTTTTSAFGQTSTASTGFGGFSSNTTNTLGGGGGLFGNKAPPSFGATGAFGAPATSTTNTFGGFGAPAQGSLFNSTLNKPAAPATLGGFGTTAAAQPLGTGFGLGTGGTSLFGNTAAKPSLFGTTPQANTSTFGSAFGTTGTLGGGGLGQNTLGMGQGLGTLGQAQQPAGISIHQQILTMATSPYGDHPIYKDLQGAGNLSEDALKPTNPAAQKAMLESSSNQFKVSPRVSLGLKVKPVGTNSTKKSLFGGLEEFDSSVDESFNLKPNAKRLILKTKVTGSPAIASNSASPAHQSLNRFTSSGTPEHSSRRLNISRSGTPAPKAAATNDGPNAVDSGVTVDDSFRNQIPTTAPAALRAEEDNARRVSWLHSNALEKASKQNPNADLPLDNTINELVGSKESSLPAGRNVYLERRSGPEEGRTKATMAAHTSSESLGVGHSFLDDTQSDLSLINTEANPAGVILQRSGYYTIPSLDSLVDYMASDGSCVVPNLTIGRRGYGSVYYDVEIDIAGLNLDELVHFRHKEVIIYPDDENKPPVGQELNRRAEVTLDQVWPHDKTLRQPIKDRERLEAMDYQAKLRRVCEKHDMRFVDYRPETGSWVFRVDHFSKYGLNDSDEDDEEPVDPKKAKFASAEVIPAAGGGPLGVPAKTSFLRPLDKDGVPIEQHGLGGFADQEDFTMDFGHHQQQQGAHHVGFQAISPSAANAMDVGTDSHKLQLMKASFFVDDDFDGKSVMSEQLDGRDSPDQTVPHPAFLRNRANAYSVASSSSIAHSKGPPSSTTASTKLDHLIETVSNQRLILTAAATESDTPTAIAKPLGPKSAPLHVKPKVALVKIPRTVIPLSKSIVASIDTRSSSDIAFALGRRFKIGWAAQNVMISLNTFNGCQRLPLRQAVPIEDVVSRLYRGRAADDRTRTLLVHSKIASIEPIPTFAESIEEHLQLQLKHCTRNVRPGDPCPLIGSGGSTTILEEHLEVARVNAQLGFTEDYVVTVWSLCNALWGEQEELDGEDVNGHLTVMRRRELLSEWLEAVVGESESSAKNGDTYLEHLLRLLFTHQVTEACDLSFNNDDLNLAFLLAQLSGGPAVRQLMQHQMSAWQEVEADAFIEVQRLKAYMLVSGVSLISSAHGAINIFEDLDWLKALALNVWYLSSATASITDSLLAYEQSFQSEEFHAQPPTPPYTNSYQPERGSKQPVEDIRFHLLKLYSKRSHPLESLLNPATHTPDTMDFRLSWLLLQTLESLGYRHCSQLSATQLHVSFASQLENQGLWHWAIFVLMHITDAQQRHISVQTMLYKYVRLSADDGPTVEADGDEGAAAASSYDDKESFVVNECRVSQRWIFWAKAVRAGALGKPHAQAEYLLKAEQWAMAHDVIMTHIAPDAIINDNILYIKSLLNRFQDVRQIPNWSNQGSILLEYIDLSEKFEQLKHVSNTRIESGWQQLKPHLSELCSRINLFPAPTAKHRLCQSEIAQRLANLVCGVRLMCPDIDSCALLRSILEKLPLPQEYAKQKLRILLEDNRLVDELQQRETTA